MGSCTSTTQNNDNDVQMTPVTDEQGELDKREHDIEVIVAKRVEEVEIRLKHQFEMEMKVLSEMLLREQRMYKESEMNAIQLRQDIYQLKQNVEELSAKNNSLSVTIKNLTEALNKSYNENTHLRMEGGSSQTAQPTDTDESENRKMKCGVVVRFFV